MDSNLNNNNENSKDKVEETEILEKVNVEDTQEITISETEESATNIEKNIEDTIVEEVVETIENDSKEEKNEEAKEEKSEKVEEVEDVVKDEEVVNEDNKQTVGEKTEEVSGESKVNKPKKEKKVGLIVAISVAAIVLIIAIGVTVGFKVFKKSTVTGGSATEEFQVTELTDEGIKSLMMNQKLVYSANEYSIVESNLLSFEIKNRDDIDDKTKLVILEVGMDVGTATATFVVNGKFIATKDGWTVDSKNVSQVLDVKPKLTMEDGLKDIIKNRTLFYDNSESIDLKSDILKDTEIVSIEENKEYGGYNFDINLLLSNGIIQDKVPVTGRFYFDDEKFVWDTVIDKTSLSMNTDKRDLSNKKLVEGVTGNDILNFLAKDVDEITATVTTDLRSNVRVNFPLENNKFDCIEYEFKENLDGITAKFNLESKNGVLEKINVSGDIEYDSIKLGENKNVYFFIREIKEENARAIKDEEIYNIITDVQLSKDKIITADIAKKFKREKELNDGSDQYVNGTVEIKGEKIEIQVQASIKDKDNEIIWTLAKVVEKGDDRWKEF